MSEKHMPTMATVEAAWDAMGEGRFVAWLAQFEEQVRATERARVLDAHKCDEQAERAYRRAVAAEQALRDERAKRPDREQIDRIQSEIDNVHQIHGDTCLCGFKSSRSRSRTEHLTALFAEAVLALEPETDQELQDRIEVLEKNLAYEVAQKIKLAEQLQAATVTGLTLEQARWKLHAGIESRCSEEVAAEAKPVIDLVFSSLALEPEAREEKPPVYLAFDLWSALRLSDADAEFDGYYERNGWADTWSNLLAEVRLRSGARPCGQDADGEPCVLMTESHLVHYGESDVGSSEPLPAPEGHKDE